MPPQSGDPIRQGVAFFCDHSLLSLLVAFLIRSYGRAHIFGHYLVQEFPSFLGAKFGMDKALPETCPEIYDLHQENQRQRVGPIVIRRLAVDVIRVGVQGRKEEARQAVSVVSAGVFDPRSGKGGDASL